MGSSTWALGHDPSTSQPSYLVLNISGEENQFNSAGTNAIIIESGANCGSGTISSQGTGSLAASFQSSRTKDWCTYPCVIGKSPACTRSCASSSSFLQRTNAVQSTSPRNYRAKSTVTVT